MPWVYLDDHFDEHPKVVDARDRHRDAPWLFVAGLCYCRRSRSDGLILSSQVPRLVTRFVKAAATALVEARLWDELPSGDIVVHDYRQWNRPSESKSASARNAARVRWEEERRRKEGGNA